MGLAAESYLRNHFLGDNDFSVVFDDVAYASSAPKPMKRESCLDRRDFAIALYQRID